MICLICLTFKCETIFVVKRCLSYICDGLKLVSFASVYSMIVECCKKSVVADSFSCVSIVVADVSSAWFSTSLATSSDDVAIRVSCKTIRYPLVLVHLVTGQFADKPTRGQSSRGLVNSRTSQLTKTFDLKFAVNIHYQCDLW